MLSTNTRVSQLFLIGFSLSWLALPITSFSIERSQAEVMLEAESSLLSGNNQTSTEAVESPIFSYLKKEFLGKKEAGLKDHSYMSNRLEKWVDKYDDMALASEIAWRYYDLEEYVRAQYWFQKTQKLVNTNDDSQFGLLLTLEKLGKYDEIRNIIARTPNPIAKIQGVLARSKKIEEPVKSVSVPKPSAPNKIVKSPRVSRVPLPREAVARPRDSRTPLPREVSRTPRAPVAPVSRRTTVQDPIFLYLKEEFTNRKKVGLKEHIYMSNQLEPWVDKYNDTGLAETVAWRYYDFEKYTLAQYWFQKTQKIRTTNDGAQFGQLLTLEKLGEYDLMRNIISKIPNPTSDIREVAKRINKVRAAPKPVVRAAVAKPTRAAIPRKAVQSPVFSYLKEEFLKRKKVSLKEHSYMSNQLEPWVDKYNDAGLAESIAWRYYNFEKYTLAQYWFQKTQKSRRTNDGAQFGLLLSLEQLGEYDLMRSIIAGIPNPISDIREVADRIGIMEVESSSPSGVAPPPRGEIERNRGYLPTEKIERPRDASRGYYPREDVAPRYTAQPSLPREVVERELITQPSLASLARERIERPQTSRPSFSRGKVDNIPRNVQPYYSREEVESSRVNSIPRSRGAVENPYITQPAALRQTTESSRFSQPSFYRETTESPIYSYLKEEFLSKENAGLKEHAYMSGQLEKWVDKYSDIDMATVIAWRYYDFEEFPLAEYWFQKTQNSGATNDEAQYGLLLTQEKSGKYERMLKGISQTSNPTPEIQSVADRAYKYQAWQYFNNGSYAKAQDYASRVSSSGDLEAMELNALINLKEGNNETSAQLFEQLYFNEPSQKYAEGYVQAQSQVDTGELKEKGIKAGGYLEVEVNKFYAQQLYSRKQFQAAHKLAPNKFPGLKNIDSPTIELEAGILQRSGEDGLQSLTHSKAPLLSASFTANGNHHFKLHLSRLSLNSGRPNKCGSLIGPFSDPSFELACQSTTAGLKLQEQRLQSAMDVKFSYRKDGWFSPYLNLGVTPIAFDGNLDPKLTFKAGFEKQQGFGYWGLEAYSQPVRESILSYTGARDPYQGGLNQLFGLGQNEEWGQVLRTGAKATVFTLFNEDTWSFWGQIDYAGLSGSDVEKNSTFSVAASLSKYIDISGFDYFSVGPSVSYQHFDKNLSHFTFGHGGYFSPDSYLNIGLGLDFLTDEGRDFIIKGKFVAGYQSINEDSSPWFPTYNEALGSYAGDKNNGQAFNIEVKGVWLAQSRFQVGGGLTFNQSKGYTDYAAAFFLRYTWDKRKAVYSTDIPDSIFDFYY